MGWAASSSSTGTSHSLTLPAGSPGDLMILVTSSPEMPNTPVGWTVTPFTPPYYNVSTAGAQMRVFVRDRQSGDSAVTVTFPAATTSSMVVWSGPGTLMDPELFDHFGWLGSGDQGPSSPWSRLLAYETSASLTLMVARSATLTVEDGSDFAVNAVTTGNPPLGELWALSRTESQGPTATIDLSGVTGTGTGRQSIGVFEIAQPPAPVTSGWRIGIGFPTTPPTPQLPEAWTTTTWDVQESPNAGSLALNLPPGQPGALVAGAITIEGGNPTPLPEAPDGFTWIRPIRPYNSTFTAILVGTRPTGSTITLPLDPANQAVTAALATFSGLTSSDLSHVLAEEVDIWATATGVTATAAAGSIVLGVAYYALSSGYPVSPLVLTATESVVAQLDVGYFLTPSDGIPNSVVTVWAAKSPGPTISASTSDVGYPAPGHLVVGPAT